MMVSLETETVLDHVHGQILLHPLCVEIVDTPEYQRLRNLSQVGPVCYVFPGGSHKRFEHCVGVSHLAGVLVMNLQRHQPSLNITPEDILCVQVAGLIHDLGHGPFSHLYDGAFLPVVRPEVCSGKSGFKHERMSVEIFSLLLERNSIDVSKYNLKDVDITFIKECVLGKELEGGIGARVGRPREKSYLYDIVSNAHSGLDVDKLDYFARDAKKTGLKSGCDFDRVLTEGRVVMVEEQIGNETLTIPRIAFPDKLIGDILAAFQTRYQLHNNVYQHKVVKSIEFMMVDVMVEAERGNLLKFVAPDETGTQREFTLSTVIESPAAFFLTNDHIIDSIRISTSTHPSAKKARALLHRIETRDLYESVGEVSVPCQASNGNNQTDESSTCNKRRKLDNVPPENLETLFLKGRQTILKELLNTSAGQGDGFESPLKDDDVIVELMKIHHGYKSKNPCSRIYFFSKSSQGMCARQLPEDRYDSLCPRTFMKRAIRVFTRRRAVSQVKQVHSAFVQLLSKYGSKDDGSSTPKDSQFPFLHPASTTSPIANSGQSLVTADGPNPWLRTTTSQPNPSRFRRKTIKTIRDQIYGQIEIPPLLVAVMDTPQFQRLRSLNQLGCSSFVFPGASHSRFEHSIGVAYLSGKMVTHLAASQHDCPDAERINESDVLCVQLAGLLHDLGHGPFSHVFEGTFLKRSRPARSDYCHEHMSVQLLDILLKENHISLGEYGLDESDLRFVKECILGSELPGGVGARSGRSREKSFLYDIVSNVHSGLDTDKLDYYERDAKNTGVRSGSDVQSLIVECRIGHVKVPKNQRGSRATKNRGVPHIVFPDKLVSEVLGAFQTRYRLHNRVYQNKVVKAVELMLVDALVSADSAGILKFPISSDENATMVSLSQSIDHPNAFVFTNDSVLHMIRCSTDPKGAEARAIVRRLDGRDLYQSVGELPIRQFAEEPESASTLVKAPLDDGEKASLNDGEKAPLNDREKASLNDREKAPLNDRENDTTDLFVTTSNSPSSRNSTPNVNGDGTPKRKSCSSARPKILDFAEPLNTLGLAFKKNPKYEHLVSSPGTPGSFGDDQSQSMTQATQVTVGDDEVPLQYKYGSQELLEVSSKGDHVVDHKFKVSKSLINAHLSQLYQLEVNEIVRLILETEQAKNIRLYPSALEAGMFIVEKMRVHHGMGAENPCNRMFFYSKNKPNHSRHLKEYRYDTLCPKTFQKKAIRVYSRSSDPKRIRQIHNALLEALERFGCERQGFAPSSSVVESPIANHEVSATESLCGIDEEEDEDVEVDMM